jgi:hypothetical protein
MSHQIQPFTWIVRFDVAPEWVADGFSLCDERALEMLSRETSGCMSTELAARVIAAPAPGRIVRAEQGYPKQGARTAAEIQSLVSGAPHAYCSGARHHAAPPTLVETLTNAIKLLDSVAFVKDENDNTQAVLHGLRQSLAIVTGEAPISEIEWVETPE